MSFILDALRKSESQRRLEAVPEIMRVPIAVQRDRVPPWTIAVMTTLGLALAATAFVGWRNHQTRPLTSMATPAGDSSGGQKATLDERPADPPVTMTPQNATFDAAARDAAASAAARDEERAAARRIVPDSRVTVDEPAARAPAPVVTNAPASDGAQAAGGAAPASDVSTLPSVAALQASGVAIPELDLQLLVTSSTPASRLVVINGRRYREGDRLIEGSEVVAIIEPGAVMRHAGHDFLLAPD